MDGIEKYILMYTSKDGILHRDGVKVDIPTDAPADAPAAGCSLILDVHTLKIISCRLKNR